MEILYYIFIKPFVLVLELSFGVVARIMFARSQLFFAFFIGALLILPLYLEVDAYRHMLHNSIKQENTKEKWKKHLLVLTSSIFSLLSMVLISVSVRMFISENPYLAGVTLGFIKDLSKPDGVIILFGYTFNILPILYLLSNVVLTLFTVKGNYFKIVLLAESAVMTVIIYKMPSAVMLFWLLFTCMLYTDSIAKYLLNLSKNKKSVNTVGLKEESSESKPDYLFFFCGLSFIILLAGYYIPTNIIKVSPQEFVDITNMKNPMHYILYSMALSVGSFGLWGTICYAFAKTKIKKVLDKIVWTLVCFASTDYIFSGGYQGEISPSLVYFDFREYSFLRIALSFALAIMFSIMILLLYKRKKEIVKILFGVELGFLCASVIVNTVVINKDYAKTKNIINNQEDEERITLSTKGKNVVVLIMDRALGPVVPFLFDEKTELIDEFDGFTYFPNTVSFAEFTNTGIPPVYGGYEYTPERMNAREDEWLEDKHNEALKVLPVLFLNNDYDVTVIDPAYAGFNWIPDLSIYDDYPEINAFRLEGKFKNQYPDDYYPEEETLKRNFFVHSFMKILPLNWQELLYDGGDYCDLNTNICILSSKYTQDGYYTVFMNQYYVLKNLSNLTVVENTEEDHFVSMYNATPHMECLLQEPDYVPKKHVDNTSLHSENEWERHLGDRVLYTWSPEQVEFYHVNMATFLALGDWFKYLKDNNCYDNTRIIIVADHGADVQHFDSVLENNLDIENFLPALLVKDFDSHGGLKESNECMTNADVPFLATNGIINQPVNPFTGNPLDAHEKEEMEEYHIFYSMENNLSRNHGKVLKEGLWFSLKGGNPYILSNWSYLGKY